MKLNTKSKPKLKTDHRRPDEGSGRICVAGAKSNSSRRAWRFRWQPQDMRRHSMFGGRPQESQGGCWACAVETGQPQDIWRWSRFSGWPRGLQHRSRFRGHSQDMCCWNRIRGRPQGLQRLNRNGGDHSSGAGLKAGCWICAAGTQPESSCRACPTRAVSEGRPQVLRRQSRFRAKLGPRSRHVTEVEK